MTHFWVRRPAPTARSGSIADRLIHWSEVLTRATGTRLDRLFLSAPSPQEACCSRNHATALQASRSLRQRLIVGRPFRLSVTNLVTHARLLLLRSETPWRTLERAAAGLSPRNHAATLQASRSLRQRLIVGRPFRLQPAFRPAFVLTLSPSLLRQRSLRHRVGIATDGKCQVSHVSIASSSAFRPARRRRLRLCYQLELVSIASSSAFGPALCSPSR